MTIDAALCHKVADLALSSHCHNQMVVLGIGIGEWEGAEDDDPGVVVPISQMREHMCSTPACLGGYTVLLTAPADWTTDGDGLWDAGGTYQGDVLGYAAGKLGFGSLEVQEVFLCWDNAEAIRRLRRIADAA
jgi:hypothetical protein